MLATWRVCCYMGAGAKWHIETTATEIGLQVRRRVIIYTRSTRIYTRIIFSPFDSIFFLTGMSLVLVLLLLHSVEQKVIFYALVIVENSSTPIIQAHIASIPSYPFSSGKTKGSTSSLRNIFYSGLFKHTRVYSYTIRT